MDNSGFLKSEVEDQMDLMLMEMGFSGPAACDDQIPDMGFNNINKENNVINGSCCNGDFENYYADSPALMSSISFSGAAFKHNSGKSSVAAMREMIFRIAAMQPVHIDPESEKPSRRKNVKISTDPQSVAARHRREKISERIRILQRLVPGGTKMDTASMLDEAIHYVKFLKDQVRSLERVERNRPSDEGIGLFPASSWGYVPAAATGYNHHQSAHGSVQNLTDC